MARLARAGVASNIAARQLYGSAGKERMVDKNEIQKVEAYMRRTFNNTSLRIVARPRKKDSAEVFIGEEFIGVVFEDKEDGDNSYNFQMAILDTDLEA